MEKSPEPIMALSAPPPAASRPPYAYTVTNCEDCGKVFTDKRKLLNHRNIVHLKNVEANECKLCEYITQNKSAFRKHMKKHQPCTMCNYISKSIPDFRKHLREVHKKDPEVCIQNVDPWDSKFKSIQIQFRVTRVRKDGEIQQCQIMTEPDSRGNILFCKSCVTSLVCNEKITHLAV